MIKIRAATEKDAESIALIYQAASGQTSNKSWNVAIATGTLVVAVIDNRLVGFGGLDLESAAPLKWLYVVPDSQRLGVGSALLEGLEMMARSAGLHSLCLHAAIDATNFYSQHGYRECRSRKDQCMIMRVWR